MGSESTIWVISKGTYSDYRVLCALPTKAAADDLAMRMKAYETGPYDDEVRVESLPMVDPDVQRVEILSLRVNLWDDGTESEERQNLRVEWPFDTLYAEDALPVHWRWVRAPVHQGRGGRLEVSGTDHERVRRVYSDRRAMLKSDDALRSRSEQKGKR